MAQDCLPNFISRMLLTGITAIMMLLMSCSTVFAGARHLLETTMLEIAWLLKLELPPLPDVPSLSKPKLPTLSKTELSPLSKIASLPRPELSIVPKLVVPTIPHLPDLPKPALPTVPTLNKDILIPPHSTNKP
ncbi:protein PELPK1-like [Juglans microcarpa x Juglans regia]|uniref:protein PELPK1-like n=1 Tax=Juglans microcarpa x Juglans regia TaxID=2249226 RepID=UPI001B7E604F|nr:protein PELPK1-like [Juglans microcarpa x Juglans regia]